MHRLDYVKSGANFAQKSFLAQIREKDRWGFWAKTLLFYLLKIAWILLEKEFISDNANWKFNMQIA